VKNIKLLSQSQNSLEFRHNRFYSSILGQHRKVDVLKVFRHCADISQDYLHHKDGMRQLNVCGLLNLFQESTKYRMS